MSPSVGAVRSALVTGAGGFVGANLVRRLTPEVTDVYCAVRPGGERWRLHNLARNAHVLEVDLTEHESVRGLVGRLQPEWVFNCAAYGAYPRQTDLTKALAVNLLGTVALVRACIEVGSKAIVHLGSSSEYGFKDHASGEDEFIKPYSEYAATKAAATVMVSYLGRAAGAPLSILRLYSVYGPWEDPQRLVPTLLSYASRGAWPPMAERTTARDFVYVGDVTEALVCAARVAGRGESGRIFNVATGVQTTLESLVGMVQKLFAVPDAPRWSRANRREWDSPVWFGRTDRTELELGWLATTGLRDGLKLMYRWMQVDEVGRLVYGLSA